MDTGMHALGRRLDKPAVQAVGTTVGACGMKFRLTAELHTN